MYNHYHYAFQSVSVLEFLSIHFLIYKRFESM